MINQLISIYEQWVGRWIETRKFSNLHKTTDNSINIGNGDERLKIALRLMTDEAGKIIGNYKIQGKWIS